MFIVMVLNLIFSMKNQLKYSKSYYKNQELKEFSNISFQNSRTLNNFAATHKQGSHQNFRKKSREKLSKIKEICNISLILF